MEWGIVFVFDASDTDQTKYFSNNNNNKRWIICSRSGLYANICSNSCRWRSKCAGKREGVCCSVPILFQRLITVHYFGGAHLFVCFSICQPFDSFILVWRLLIDSESKRSSLWNIHRTDTQCPPVVYSKLTGKPIDTECFVIIHLYRCRFSWNQILW